MWILYAFGSALFAGLTAVLAKCGIRKTDSTVATAIRTIVVLAFSWLEEKQLWTCINAVKAVGATGILVLNIEEMVV